MNKADIVRAWKDPLYRATLSPEQLAELPAHPAGLVEIDEERLLAAGAQAPVTTARTCTEYTFLNMHDCCPKP
jgi:mersacidin/lichenicidin family type 2 lantibiotic